MKLFDLGELPWKQTQLLYHALGTCGEESIVICTPKEEYACVGFHQDITQELDIEFCKNQDIGVFRREIGGGTVFLDQNQLFYQIIVDRKRAPLDQRVFFRKFLQPILDTYHALGINVQFVPICDLVVNGKKISGNGGGDIGSCKVVTGSFLLDFDFKIMSQILNLPSEKFRQNIFSAMVKNMTTIKNELGHMPDHKEITSILISKCENMFGHLEQSTLSQATLDLMNKMDEKFSSKEWVFKKRKHKGSRTIKIIEGKNLSYYTNKGVEMCIETLVEKIQNIELYSEHAQEYKTKLNELLMGNEFDETLVTKAVKTIFNQ